MCGPSVGAVACLAGVKGKDRVVMNVWFRSCGCRCVVWGSRRPLVDRIGLRATITAAAALVFVGTVVRSLTVTAPYALALAHLGQILNAAAGPLGAAAPTGFSGMSPCLHLRPLERVDV